MLQQRHSLFPFLQYHKWKIRYETPETSALIMWEEGLRLPHAVEVEDTGRENLPLQMLGTVSGTQGGLCWVACRLRAENAVTTCLEQPDWRARGGLEFPYPCVNRRIGKGHVIFEIGLQGWKTSVSDKQPGLISSLWKEEIHANRQNNYRTLYPM